MNRTLNFNKPWILQRADPYVYKHKDGQYYFTASLPSYDAVVLRKASTLEGLQEAEEVTVWEKHETGIMGAHIWAPELHYLQGKWYIYFAGGNADDIWAIRPYVLECADEDPLTGTWIEKGKMGSADNDVFSFEGFSLDATVFESRGRHYYVWAEKVGVGRQISNLYIGEMESPFKLKSQQVMLTTPDYDWERAGFWVNEGPAVLKKDGRIFLTYSASDTGINYCMGMLTADEDSDLLDPGSWKKERLPVMQTDESYGIYGPGHNSFTKDEEGNDIMVYHARIKKEIAGNPLYEPNRHAMLMRINWNHNGRPVFGF
ncbi:glycoside hydrolase family 43 protein [Anaerobium acetethylicum]|uniref:Beta-xylosidase, GH43 family n=1 Tax=Anaerobium acetethylicum TaxID=1619234 RepID=A0A1D3TY42_9FIRM|nr:family 43 glycosylhydrolase [Anaerobium acetethylicum]SCP99330.1 Beta-xylosidase, GH43 family [Anaerobium acetethylicum]